MNDDFIRPDLSKVIQISPDFAADMGDGFTKASGEAEDYLMFYD